MNQSIHQQLQELPFTIAIFDEAEGDGEGDGKEGDGEKDEGQSAAATPDRSRDRNGRYAQTDGDVVRQLTTAEARIAELNRENTTRRKQYNETKSELDALKAQAELTTKRAIRAETRVALQAAGAVDTDVVDLFLAWAGDKVKMDPKSGDIVGLEHIADYKKLKSAFFKPETTEGEGTADGKEGDGKNGDEEGKDSGKDGKSDTDKSGKSDAGKNGKGADTRGNATGKGASAAGGASGDGKNGKKIADFRDPKVDPDKAINDYMRTLR